MLLPKISESRNCSGFTLAEMAIVLVIVSILMGGMVVGLTTQMDNAKQTQTEQTLVDIREALLGFAVAKNRLPCPAAPGATGVESPTGGTCTNPWNGFVPGTTLGIGPTDPQGYVLDGWNQRIRYAVTTANAGAWDFTTSGRMSVVGMTDLAPDLRVCASATGITATTCGTATSLTDNAVAVIYSIGRNGGTGGTGADEAANPNPQSANNDRVFVSHTPAATAGNPFDDIVTWVSPYTLYSRMITAGRLP